MIKKMASRRQLLGGRRELAIIDDGWKGDGREGRKGRKGGRMKKRNKLEDSEDVRKYKR